MGAPLVAVRGGWPAARTWRPPVCAPVGTDVVVVAAAAAADWKPARGGELVASCANQERAAASAAHSAKHPFVCQTLQPEQLVESASQDGEREHSTFAPERAASLVAHAAKSARLCPSPDGKLDERLARRERELIIIHLAAATCSRRPT